MRADSQPAEELWIHDAETIKVMTAPRRMEILQQMETPTTVKAVAEKIGMSASKLYYHVHRLEKQGLLRVVGQNLDSGIVEKIYQVTAKQFKLINPLLAGAAMPVDVADSLLTALLDETQRNFRRAFVNRDLAEGSPPRHPFFSKKAFRLNQTQLTMLHSQLDALINEVQKLGEENASSAEDSFELAVVFYKTEPKT